jgi:multiple sugar transport system substrate-binding protein
MGWTVDEFNEVVNSLPSGMAPLANQTQTTLLTASLSASMDSFVDSAKGEVTFDTPEFYQLLDYAKTYGTADDLSKDGGVYVDEQTMLQNGELAMTNCNIYDPSSYAQYITMVGGPISVVGYPSSDKRGPMCYMNTLLSISSSSGSKQAAWDFVKSFFSEEAQTNTEQIYQIPVLKTAFEAQIEKAMNPDTTNGGKGIIYDKMGQAAPMTGEAAKAYRDLVNGLDTLAVSDQEIVNIVLEEVPEYFNGGKSDEDVAKIIQDRVQTLVNER